MIIKALILTTLLTSEPAIVLSVLLNAGEIHAMPPEDTKIEARRRGGKQRKGRKRGGNGLR